jgi:hypothetical protein
MAVLHCHCPTLLLRRTLFLQTEPGQTKVNETQRILCIQTCRRLIEQPKRPGG